jgi:DNA-binding response OmpR family regulator
VFLRTRKIDNEMELEMAVILVADDDDILIELARFRLEHDGHSVLTATDGRAAVESVRKYLPDLIILDAMMPVLNGLEVLHEIKRDAETSAIPVLMLTARKGEADVIGALKSGASDYMTKPFAPQELAARVDVLLARSRYAQQGV